VGVRDRVPDAQPRRTKAAVTAADTAPRTVAEPPAEPADASRPTRRSTHVVTLDDVARHAQVSPQTVSRSIRAPDQVSVHTLERVRRSITATGYVPNLAASNLASNRSMTVAAIVPDVSASVFADALHGLEEVLAPSGYHLFIGSTGYRPDHEEDLVRAFLGRRPDGFFIVGTTHTDRTTRMLRESRVPTVETWEMSETPIDSLVGFSNRDAARAVVRYAADRGYRHPTFAGSLQTGDFRAARRRDAFVEAVPELFPGEAVRVVDSGTQKVDLDTGRLLLHMARSLHPETDVLMFASDVFAAGAILEADRRGIRIPEDLAVTGFGDFELARHLLPTLTTVSVPNRRIGTVAGTVLLDRMSGRTSDVSIVDLDFSIVARESA